MGYRERDFGAAGNAGDFAGGAPRQADAHAGAAGAAQELRRAVAVPALVHHIAIDGQHLDK